MKILIDIAGADKGTLVPLKAALNLSHLKDKIILVGTEKDITEGLAKLKVEDITKFQTIYCEEYITNSDEPAFAIKNKKKSNIVLALEYMKEHENTILVSASSTGALMAGGLLKLGRIKGIHRPALTSLIPTVTGRDVVFLDSGANPEAKEISLLQYAKLGEIYSKNVLDVENPKIALLNIGAEEEKGTPVLKETHKLLKLHQANFVGNIEARYILSGKVDVIVCEGIMGNVALKSLEGTASTLKNVITNEFKSNIFSKLVGLLAKPILQKALKKFDYKEREGAILLGIKKPIIKVHGSSNAITYEKAILQAEKVITSNMMHKIEEEISSSYIIEVE